MRRCQVFFCPDTFRISRGKTESNTQSQEPELKINAHLWCLLLVLVCMVGCTTYQPKIKRTYSHSYEYYSPKQQQFDNTLVLARTYDEVWKSVVSYFSETNISIETVEMDSGIIIAERIYGDSNEAQGYIEPGTIKKTTYIIETESVPYFDPNYLTTLYRQGAVATRFKGETEFDASYSVILKFNVFVEKLDKSNTSLRVNTDFKATEQVHGYNPKPVSSGSFEKGIFDYVRRRLGLRVTNGL